MTVAGAGPAAPIPGESRAALSTSGPGRVIDTGDPSAEAPQGFPEEDRWVQAARTDRQAFGLLYDRYFEAIYRYVFRRVGDAETAEDLTAAVWEKALIAIERYELRGVPFGAWLYRIAGNVVSNHHRQRRLWRFVPLLANLGREEETEALDEASAVRAAFRALSGPDQEALSLYYFAELTPPEMAQVLGCSVAAVHKRVGRARDRLRRLLEDTGTHDRAKS